MWQLSGVCMNQECGGSSSSSSGGEKRDGGGWSREVEKNEVSQVPPSGSRRRRHRAADRSPPWHTASVLLTTTTEYSLTTAFSRLPPHSYANFGFMCPRQLANASEWLRWDASLAFSFLIIDDCDSWQGGSVARAQKRGNSPPRRNVCFLDWSSQHRINSSIGIDRVKLHDP